MSKELDAFSRITLHTDFDNDGSYDIEKFEDDCKGVEEALQKLYDIKKSKKSRAMRCLKRVWNDINGHNDFRQDFKDLTIIENYILKAQEQEKVFDIIIKKNVSVWGFRNRVFGYQKEQNGNITVNDTYEYYLTMFGCYHNGFDIELLTEEEFNTLKEYFKDERNRIER